MRRGFIKAVCRTGLDKWRADVYTYGYKIEKGLQGRVRFPTGGKAHEPQGMIR